MNRRSIGVAFAGATTFLNLYSTQVVLPQIAESFNAPIARTSLTVTGSLLAVAGVAPFVGSISDMFGRKKLIVAAAYILVLPTIWAAFAATIDGLILIRFLQGLLLPFIFTVTIAYLGDETEGADSIKLAGIWSVGTVTGGFTGRAVAGVVASLLDWRASFLAIAVLTFIGATIVTVLMPREQRFVPVRGIHSSLVSFIEHLENRRLLATYAVGFAVLFTLIATFTYSNFLLAAPPFNLGPAGIGFIFIVYLLAVPMTPVATHIAVRIGRRPTVAMAVGLIITGQLVTLVGTLTSVVIGLTLISGGVFIEQALATGYIGVAARRAKSTAVGLYVTCYYVGGSAGGIVPAGIWHRAGWPGCVALCIIVQLVLLAIVAAFWRDAPPRGEATAR